MLLKNKPKSNIPVDTVCKFDGGPRFVQTLNPRSKNWILIDREWGMIVGNRKEPYNAPQATKRDVDPPASILLPHMLDG